MVKFHFFTVRPLVQHYTRYALQNLSNETRQLKQVTSKALRLSETKEALVTRALYRLQLCCNLFGIGSHKQSWEPTSVFHPIQILDILGSCFQPWGIEEILCIVTFASDRYYQIFEAISDDIGADDPNFRGLQLFIVYEVENAGQFKLYICIRRLHCQNS